MSSSAEAKRLLAARQLFESVAQKLDGSIAVRLWDGSVIPLGPHADTRYQVVFDSAATIGRLLRKPTLENLVIHYAEGHVDLVGGDLIDFVEAAQKRRMKLKWRDLDKGTLARSLWALARAPGDLASRHVYGDDEAARVASDQRHNQDYIRFHYDISDDFYRLFLDPEMQYSCGYFTDWSNGIEQAQVDKLDHICRKLRLKPGERFLDVGCGWGGLIAHAVRHYGVIAHGVTLSTNQHDFATAKMRDLGIADKVTIELKDYRLLTGTYDKIASIGMYEHVGIANYPEYFGKLKSLLRPGGILLNHGITRRAKADKSRFRKIRPENRLILKYIFPGSELDHIGHSVESMEAAGFEVHDVEGLREHYAQTTRLWCQRLSARKDEAIALVGEAKYRLWVAYLAGVSFAFKNGTIRLFQTVATRHQKNAPLELPPTRGDLYR
ncbi:SAM-dependent methyltransferase [Zavarzinia aquatilis]|uniref:SAM-dependent methyltransferase n=1 Tax=Zavarzinia aquatilis TaxID=2211142 RepID=A0A317EHQ3_9PROT|nr:cyclopropane-fatty-acyl-phospholipid synthase family protein [Zavarzinia aquatilis]PWR24745.1 SAM-dependent methyltransferase [Zavarzinia aquatilis]